ncbi:GCD14 protein [Sodiomyces alkalinus F11]|uniref:tRNA (adenine(58)-N(1))-methyltransferase catalytic subunit TRM61 n=1 Tax=Sodiomyces alkalinus (strain CBS 110278 / VKM F-3762 / F11) TaxID=1314773 RepID=A0A3N2PWW4_SODAK|nr:GCD14 protein [Sodiomyces alkalinus F11]ROT39013.1 GCD14 protein [Sodiomyces alkalinus F11]
MGTAKTSAFLDPGHLTSHDSLAIVQLSRDNLVPLILHESESAVDGYAEGAVLNTRYGSFPHSTMVGVPWGSQIRASKVDTGSRGRKRKRKEDDDDSKVSTPAAAAAAADDQDSTSNPAPAKKAVVAASGFVHILPPTPELWTRSLPHRTQVVYTPDYSYILQRIRARPGSRLIEAGAGSGSFTHASVRAVYNGYPETDDDRRGKVYSYEFNEARYLQMKEEIKAHRLEGLVQLTHRDAYSGGFLVDGKSPEADAVFLDLPAPWEALPHLSRSRPTGKDFEDKFKDMEGEWVSPLNPKTAAYICTFSPCIEQVQRTIRAMRQLGWVEIDMIEVSQKFLSVVRDGLTLNSQPGKKAPPEPTNVEEAVGRQREIEKRSREYNALQTPGKSGSATAADSPAQGNPMDLDTANDEDGTAVDETTTGGSGDVDPDAEGDDDDAEKQGRHARKPWKQGRLVHRSESEIKTHTSYLVFATLPREWTEADEEAALARWPCGMERAVVGDLDKETRKREKREMLASKKHRKKEKQDRRDRRHDALVVADTPTTSDVASAT